jgi:drug/metabolite transporter (DMT)-like permease
MGAHSIPLFEAPLFGSGSLQGYTSSAFLISKPVSAKLQSPGKPILQYPVHPMLSLSEFLQGVRVSAAILSSGIDNSVFIAMRLKADLSLLLVSIIWGSAFVAQRVAGQMGSVYWFNGARYLLAAVVVLPFVIKANGSSTRIHVITRDQYQWMFLAGSVLFLGSALQQLGLVYTTAGNAGFITSLYVVLVPVVLFLAWHEKVHWISLVAVMLAGVGAFLLSTGGRFEIRAGDVIELGGAIFWTLHVIVLGKYAARFESMSFSVGQLVVCGLLNLGVALLAEKFVAWNLSLLGAIAYTALFSLGLCYTLQVWAQRHTPPADAALILSLESVFAVIAGWFLLDEKLGPVQVFGCILIFVAVLLSQFKEWNLRGKIDSTHLVEGR